MTRLLLHHLFFLSMNSSWATLRIMTAGFNRCRRKVRMEFAPAFQPYGNDSGPFSDFQTSRTRVKATLTC